MDYLRLFVVEGFEIICHQIICNFLWFILDYLFWIIGDCLKIGLFRIIWF